MEISWTILRLLHADRRNDKPCEVKFCSANVQQPLRLQQVFCVLMEDKTKFRKDCKLLIQLSVSNIKQ
jgi:hypothetical protein